MRMVRGISNKIIFKYMFIIAIVIVLLITFCCAIKSYSSSARSLELYWGIQIPSDFKEVYHTSIVGFHGDGFRYTVFETHNNAHLSFIKVFHSQRNQTVEDFIDKVIDQLDVAENNVPSINQSYFWWVISGDKYYDNTLVILYIPNDDKYYFIEERL